MLYKRIKLFGILIILIWSQAAFSAYSLGSWVGQGRIAGAAMYVGISLIDMEQIIANMIKQKVTVIEADSGLSNYLTDAEFDQEIKLITTFTELAHSRGLRVVWYYPSLEVLTPNGVNIEHTMYKDHPDWVQVGINGKPNVLYGGVGRVHWIDKDMESAWMSLESPYADYFRERIKKIVKTGVDGVWLDVPLLNDMGEKWADMNPYATAKFTADTGLQAPKKVDWDDPVWRLWIAWRHQEITGFLESISKMAQNISSKFNIIVETVTMDYSPTTIGLEGSEMKFSDGIIQVWEIDAVSDATAMRNARHNDWISLIAMNKFAKAASGDKPSWVFTYGLKPDDAELVMAETLATGNHPYETKIPVMTATVGEAYRTKMFSWIKQHSFSLFDSESAAPVAVFFSSASRDYIDKFGLSLYATTESDDPQWWTTDAKDSLYQRTYLAEYRGMVKWLVNQHVPFDIVVKPNLQELKKYTSIMAPDLRVLSDAEANIIKQYIAEGGIFIMTGPNPTGQDQYGTERKNYALAELFGHNKNTGLPSLLGSNYGSGSIYYASKLLAKDYLVSNDAEADKLLRYAIDATTPLPLTTDADPAVHIEMRKTSNQTLIHFINATGLDGNFSIPKANFKVNFNIPKDRQIKSLQLSSPNFAEDTINLDYSITDRTIHFQVALEAYAMAIVTYAGGEAPIINDLPVAGDDHFYVESGSSILISLADILNNDGDLDNDTLTITNIVADDIQVVEEGAGKYRYTPPKGFIGTKAFSYTIADKHGAADLGLGFIHVSPATIVYHPKTIKISTGINDGGTLASFNKLDEDSYDIKAVSSEGNYVSDWYTTTQISETVDSLAKFEVSYIGQYSKNNVTQNVYLYNYESKTWEVVDTRSVGEGKNVTVYVVISEKLGRYISKNYEMQLRIRGSKSSEEFTAWANAIKWTLTTNSNHR